MNSCAVCGKSIYNGIYCSADCARPREPDTEYTRNPDNSFIVPAGRYLLGDPCCFVNSEGTHWGRFMDTKTEFHEGSHGFLNGCETVMFYTAQGDGSYRMEDNGTQPLSVLMIMGEIGVDSGNIGLVKTDAEAEGGMFEVVFTEPAFCAAHGPKLIFGHVFVNTNPDYDNKHEEEEEIEPEDDKSSASYG